MLERLAPTDVSNISAFDTTPGDISKSSIHASTLPDTPNTAVKPRQDRSPVGPSPNTTLTADTPTYVRPRARPRPRPMASGSNEAATSSPDPNQPLFIPLMIRPIIPNTTLPSSASSPSGSNVPRIPSRAPSAKSKRSSIMASDVIDLSSSEDEGLYISFTLSGTSFNPPVCRSQR